MTIGDPRNPDSSELERVMELADQSFRIPRAQPPDAENLSPLLYSRDNLDNLWAIFDGAQPVSLVGSYPSKAIIGESEIPIAWIGEVCTRKGYRNQGLATRLIKRVFSNLESLGTAVAIVTGELNLYKRLGCVEVGSNKHNIVEKGEKDLETTYSTMDCWTEETLRRIYREENIRWERNNEEFSKLLSAHDYPREHEQIPKIYCIGEEGDEKAYWSTGLYPNPESGDRELKMVEYAGSRNALAESIPLLLEKERSERFYLYVPTWDRKILERIEKLSEKGFLEIKREENRQHPGTMKVLNEDKLKKSIETIDEEFDYYNNIESDDLLSSIPWPWTENLNWF